MDTNSKIAQLLGWKFPLSTSRKIGICPATGKVAQIPDYENDISDAWEIIRHLRKNGYRVGLYDHGVFGWTCEIVNSESVKACIKHIHSEARAICLATLEAFAVERTQTNRV